MRHAFVLLILIGALGLGAPSFARDIHLPKTSADALKSACEQAKGRFSQDPNGYGCGTNCKDGPGTDCIVHCTSEQKCIALVIGGRHPHTVAEALIKPQRHAR